MSHFYSLSIMSSEFLESFHALRVSKFILEKAPKKSALSVVDSIYPQVILKPLWSRQLGTSNTGSLPSWGLYSIRKRNTKQVSK